MQVPCSWATKSKGGTFEQSGCQGPVSMSPHTSHEMKTNQTPNGLVHPPFRTHPSQRVYVTQSRLFTTASEVHDTNGVHTRLVLSA
eukprot:5631715-Amphidinium_carterae.2